MSNSAHCFMKMSEETVDAAGCSTCRQDRTRKQEIGPAVAEVSC